MNHFNDFTLRTVAATSEKHSDNSTAAHLDRPRMSHGRAIISRKLNALEIVLIRGLPGSGKTTLAKQMISHAHVEADQFFEVSGEYLFNPEDVQKAHAWCLEQVKKALKNGKSVVVSNTFVRKWEMQPYQKLGYPVRVIVATGAYQNLHGVSPEKMEMIRGRWEA
jgi:energy-coupling factor transporter ATP-binding protein EcfA2